MDAATISVLIQGLGPIGAILVLAAYAFWSKPDVKKPYLPASNEYERDMVAAMREASGAIKDLAHTADMIERHFQVLLDRQNR